MRIETFKSRKLYQQQLPKPRIFQFSNLSIFQFSNPSFAYFCYMKPSKRIFHILFAVLVLHGSTVGFQDNIRQAELTQREETIIALNVSHLTNYTTKLENFRPQFHVLDQFPGSEGMFFSTICRIAESILCNKLSTTLVQSKKHLIRLQNTSIIFPFHNFP
jgi:hypothetical protein